MKRLLLFIVITAMGMGQGLAQALIQTYTDRCTGQVHVFTVPMNGQTVVAFYNKSKTFTAAQFTNGELQAWLEETYLWWTSLSPCSSTTTGATATQQTTQQTTQQAATAATNATASTATTNPTTNAPSSSTSPPPTTESSNPPSTDTSTANNNTSTENTSTGGTDNGSTGTGNSGSGTTEGSTSETQSNSEQTESSSPDTTESTEETTSNDSSEGTSTEDSSSETSSEDSSEQSTEEQTEEVETEESSTEEKSEESTEESKEESKDEDKKESDESSEEDSEEETDEEESKSDEDEEDKEEDSEEESNNEDEEEDDEDEKKKRTLAPPVVTANILSQQDPTGNYTYATTLGISRSSLLGTETYGINAMVFSNLQQFMLNFNYSKVHIKTENVTEIIHQTHSHYAEGNKVTSSDTIVKPVARVNRVYSGSIGIMKMYTTYVAMMNHSLVWMGKKGSVKGLAFGTSLTSLEMNMRDGIIYYDTQLLSTSLTGFYTKSVTFDRLTVSPMLAISSPFMSYDLYFHDMTWNKDLMIIGGTNFTYSLTQRFGLNLGVNIIESTIPDFPTLKTFTIGGRLSF